MRRREGRESARRRRARFERLVRAAVDEIRVQVAARRDAGRLSPRFASMYLEALDQIGIVVRDEPDARQRAENERAEDLLGIYEGVPKTEWAADHALIPPRITIFRRAIEQLAVSPEIQRREIRKTVQHELAHHLGYSDEALHRLGLGDVE